jgi:hypothetical protein
MCDIIDSQATMRKEKLLNRHWISFGDKEAVKERRTTIVLLVLFMAKMRTMTYKEARTGRMADDFKHHSIK